VTARGAAEPAEHRRVNDTEPGAGQHGDRQLGHHRHVQRHPVAGLQAQVVAQHRRELVHLPVQLRVADRHVGVGFQLRHEDDRGLARAGRGEPVHAVVAGIQPAAGEPLPERRVAGVQCRVPGLIPGEQVGVLLEAVGEAFLGEPAEDGRVGGVGLRDEPRGRRVGLLLTSVHRDLRLGDLRLRYCRVIPITRPLARAAAFRPCAGSVSRPAPRCRRALQPRLPELPRPAAGQHPAATAPRPPQAPWPLVRAYPPGRQGSPGRRLMRPRMPDNGNCFYHQANNC
jgi:hypothetical protein